VETKIVPNWTAISEAFDSLPAPTLEFDSESGDVNETAWMFRGLKHSSYSLSPTIERVANGKREWPAFESMIKEEFQAKARMHIDPRDIPQDPLSWLALMQHHGVPTRLLDFTFSPYVALYFALRNREPSPKPVAVWAIDSQRLREAIKRIHATAATEEFELYKKRNSTIGATIQLASLGDFDPFDPRSFDSPLDTLEKERDTWNFVVTAALRPSKFRRHYFNQNGLVVIASPPVQNRRLSSQQGVFLFNAAEGLNFETSLFKMMSQDAVSSWCMLFEIPAPALPDIERRLFQRNIHDLSLFPDMEGLAGFIRQKARLHWRP
jgi:hypothetical protein